MNRFFCYLKAIPFYIKSGVWCPHIYEEVGKNKGIVIASKNKFRVSNDLLHEQNETVHPHAIIIKNRCVCCGYEEFSWYDSDPIIIKS